MGDSRRVVVGVTCREESCEWGPLGTDDPATNWDVIERYRADHEKETGHRTEVACRREERIVPDPVDRSTLGEAMLRIAEDQEALIQWVCPDCGRELGEESTHRTCPECGSDVRETLP